MNADPQTWKKNTVHARAWPPTCGNDLAAGVRGHHAAPLLSPQRAVGEQLGAALLPVDIVVPARPPAHRHHVPHLPTQHSAVMIRIPVLCWHKMGWGKSKLPGVSTVS